MKKQIICKDRENHEKSKGKIDTNEAMKARKESIKYQTKVLRRSREKAERSAAIWIEAWNQAEKELANLDKELATCLSRR